jgi:hypothetical protein
VLWNRAFCAWLWQVYSLESGYTHSGWMAEDFDATDGDHIRITWPHYGSFAWSLDADPVVAFGEFRAARGLESPFPAVSRPHHAPTPEDWWIELQREIALLPDVLTDFGPIRYTRLQKVEDMAVVSITDDRIDDEIEYDLTSGFDAGVPVEIGETYIGSH